MLIQNGKDGTVLLNGIGYRVLHDPELGIIRLDILAAQTDEKAPEFYYSLVMAIEEVEQFIPALAQALASCLLVAGRRAGTDTDLLAELANAHDQLAKVRAAGYILGPDGIPYGPMPTQEPETVEGAGLWQAAAEYPPYVAPGPETSPEVS